MHLNLIITLGIDYVKFKRTLLGGLAPLLLSGLLVGQATSVTAVNMMAIMSMRERHMRISTGWRVTDATKLS